MALRFVTMKLTRLATKRTNPTTSSAMVCFWPQPLSLALENPTTRHAHPDMMSTSPIKSNVLDNSLQVVFFLGGKLRLKYRAGIANPHAGRLMKKIQRQLVRSQIKPPNRGPMTDAL
jgi:hypothetical protein